MHRMESLISASKTQEGIATAINNGTLEQCLRVYENTALVFLSKTENEVSDYGASADNNRMPSSLLPVELVSVTQCLRNLCSCPENVVYVHERGAISWIKQVVRRLAHILSSSEGPDQGNGQEKYLIKLSNFTTEKILVYTLIHTAGPKRELVKVFVIRYCMYL